MTRREFITLGGAVAAWPLAVRAQQAAMPVIGFLDPRSPEVLSDRLREFRRGLKETGYVEGENVSIVYRWAENDVERLSALAAELARRPVSVIVAAGGPGSNVTGITFVTAELGAKQLGLLHELQPEAVRIGVLVDTNYPVTASFISDVQAAASPIRKQIEVLEAPTGRDIDTAFARLAQKPIDALLVAPSPFLNNRHIQLITLATYHRVPTIYPWREATEVGGLMSYGASITDAYRHAGVYIGRILKGEKPGDLPVMQSTKFEFVINLNTAKAFGLSFPPGLLAIADEVIE
jgi:putative ABC transport system substrate-binding protein